MRNSGVTDVRFHAPAEVVRWHGAMQSQDFGPAKWSVGQRALSLSEAEVDRAVAEGSIIRTHVLRPTWHFVARDDVRWLLRLTGPRVQKGIAGRYRRFGLDARTLARCESLVTSALEGGAHLTRNEIAEIFDRAGLDRVGQRLVHMLMHCELQALICSGAPSGAQQTYALMDERVPGGSPFDRERALVEIVRRYLASHGPATMKDLGWWSSLTLADIKWALGELDSEVGSESIGGLTLWSLAAGGSAVTGAKKAHLLHVYDELLVGYTESRYLGDPRASEARAAWSDPSMPNSVLMLNGRVGGQWRRSARKDEIEIEVLLYESFTRSDLRKLEEEAGSLGRFFGREVSIRTGLVPS